MKFGTAVLLIVSAFFVVTSWTSLRFPQQFGEHLGFMIGGLDGLNEIRAQYGGFFLAAALANVLALLGIIPRQAAFVLNVVVFGGLIAGRTVSLVVDGGLQGYGHTIRSLFLVDTAGFAISLLASYVERL